jgi:GTP:adenosylcobinamide-phosphate guanylyltransferase
MSVKWTAIILAGQRPGPDPLASHFGEEWKALVHVGGEPMLTRVVRTLRSVPDISRVIVLAQDTARMQPAVDAGGGAIILPSGAGISSSIRSVAGTESAPWPVFVTTADHVLLTRPMVEEFLAGAQLSEPGRPPADVAVGMVEYQVMLSKFPEARRTWLRFSDGAWSGANLFALASARANAALDLWAEAESDRKKPLKLFLHFGLGLALRAITRTIGLGDALARAGTRLGLTARLIPMSDPVAAIDVDKVSDHVEAEAILKARDRTKAGD